jgi:hypothetical protein
MHNGKPLWAVPPGPDLLRRMAELESQMPQVLTEVREQIRRCRALCRQARVLRLESQEYRRALEESLGAAVTAGLSPAARDGSRLLETGPRLLAARPG